MVFSSMVFLWIFLPVTIIGNYIVKEKYRNLLLLLASLIFYSWGEPVYIILMLLSILINWSIGLLMEKFRTRKKLLLLLAIIINVAMIGYFKYFNFIIKVINDILHSNIKIKEIALPIGISFFTFQILSYIIDLYRGEYKAQKNIVNMALYISFFPQLIAGPIVKYRDINEQLSSRTLTLPKTAEGIRRFVYGLGKKVIIANTLAQCVDSIYQMESADLTSVLAWIAAIFYSLQIYYDFSGYSDMAIGLGKIFGFDFQENFLYPYISTSIQDFWKRWHISLSTWFREYLYIPLGGNRKGSFRTCINLLIVFLITGLWHGAKYTFILWGLYHGIFLIIERLGLRKYLDKHKIFAHIYTLFIVNIGWVFFRANSIKDACMFIKHMLMPWKFSENTVFYHSIISNKSIFLAVMGILGCGIIQNIPLPFIHKWKNSYIEIAYCSFFLVVCFAMLAANTYNPFIYFRF